MEEKRSNIKTQKKMSIIDAIKMHSYVTSYDGKIFDKPERVTSTEWKKIIPE